MQEHQSSELNSDYDCGVLSWKPKWMQRFATPRGFLFVYGFLGTVQAMTYVYFLGTLTTIERRFGIQSATTGWMLSGNEVSQILMSPMLSYMGGNSNRPVWIAWGVAFSALSCYVLASPHFIFGSGPDALALTKEYGYGNISGVGNLSGLPDLAGLALCTGDPEVPDCTPGSEAVGAPLLIFISQFFLGIGTTLYYALGQPYMDDNTKKKNTAMLLGWTMSLRTLGPSVGFFVTYACLELFVNPLLTPVISSSDPRWIGAWWLGWVLLGTVMFLFGFLIAFFPKKLRKPGQERPKAIHYDVGPLSETSVVELQPISADHASNSNGTQKLSLPSPVPKPAQPTPEYSIEDFHISLCKLMKNKLLMVNTFAGVFYVFGSSGHLTFMARNMEVQWYHSASTANVSIGPVVLGAMVAGFLLSGWVISKYKPRPTYLFSWNVVIGLGYVFSQVLALFIYCPDIPIAGFDPTTKTFNFTNSCNGGCGCESVRFAPVCHNETGLTYFSACHAGCTEFVIDELYPAYTNCSCIPDFSGTYSVHESYEQTTYKGSLQSGYCLSDCMGPEAIFFSISFLMQFLGSTGKIGNILVAYRAVNPELKSFAAGLNLFCVSLFAFIPGPVIFGYLLDSTCLYWDTTCGRERNCWFYDRDQFRLVLNGTAAGITLIGVILDALVCYYGRNIELYDDEMDETDKNLMYKESEKLQDIVDEKLNY